MAANLGDSNEDGPIAAINITPFVDVVLVLLVIFMVTAPQLVKDSLNVNLPKSSSSDQKAMQTLGVAITKQGQILVNGTATTFESLKEEAKKAVTANPDAQAVISADTDSRHGDVVKVIDAIKSAGLSKFAIQIQKE